MAERWGNGRGGRPWRRLVDAVKRRDQYVCQLCGRLTEQGCCDHKMPTSKGGTDDMGNLQWLCVPCHDTKTKTEAESAEAKGRRVRVQIGADGWPVG